MVKNNSGIGKRVELKTDYHSALQRVVVALQAEGFGVLTQIDVKDTFKQKLDIDFQRYTILGACNPKLAYQALSAVPEVGLLLPCNVTVADRDNGTVEITLVDPLAMLGVVQNPELESIAQEVDSRFDRVVVNLKASELSSE